MSRHHLNDDQWAVIEPLTPKQKPRVGRKRADVHKIYVEDFRETYTAEIRK
jgi:transposase